MALFAKLSRIRARARTLRVRGRIQTRPWLEGLEERALLSLQAVSLANPSLYAAGGIGTFTQTGRTLSDDGRYALFNAGDNIVPGDSNSLSDVFVRDRQTGAVTLVSTTPGGTSGNGSSSAGAISPNGRYVVFVSDAGNLVPGSSTGQTEIYVRDLVNHTTTLVSANNAGTPADSFSYSPAMTPDGRYVAFLTNAQNLVSGGPPSGIQLYLRDLVNHATTLVSTGLPSSSFGNTTLGGPLISDSGQYIAFQSAQPISNAIRNLYLRDVVNNTTTIITPGVSGAVANGNSSNMVMTPDGRYVAFVSEASNLIANDVNGRIQDVFVRDTVLNKTTLVSATSTNQSGNDASSVDGWGNAEAPSISNDGRYVSFSSWATNLAGAPGGSNHLDVYVRDLSSLSTVRASSKPNGGQSSYGASNHSVLSADGSHVAFFSYSAELSSLTDQLNTQDLFLRDLTANQTAVVTVNAAGTATSGASSLDSVFLTSNSRYVAFNGPLDNLTAQDGDHLTDAFVRDMSTGTTTMVSTHDPALPSLTGNDDSYIMGVGWHETAMSADGRYITFTSRADNLVPNDTNFSTDVFVADKLTGTVTLASANAAGTASASGDSQSPAISADGHLVAFTSIANDLVSTPDSNGSGDVFVRNLTTNQTTLVSVNSAGTASTSGGASVPVLTPDGRYVVFRSNSFDLTNNPPSGYYGIYRRDLTTQTTSLVSVNTSGAGGNGFSTNASVTPDGRYVVFESYASDLVAGDTNGDLDVFVRDMQSGQTYLVSANMNASASGQGASRNASITPDGRFVVFESTASDLVPGDANNSSDVFVRDLVLGQTYRVSSNTSNAAGNAGSQNAVISNNGRYIAFDSDASDLVPGDTNNATDVFIRDLTTGQTTLVSVNQTGSGPGTGTSSYPALSADGRRVLFSTAAPDLVANDLNGTYRNVALRDLNLGATTLLDPHTGRYAFALDQSLEITPDGHHAAFGAFGDDLTAGDYNSRQDVFVWGDGSPVARPGAGYAVAEGSSITLDGSASSDADSPLTTYEWDFNYNGTTFVQSATGVTASFSAAALNGPTTRTVALRVTDQAGAQSIATTTVTVSNVTPTLTVPGNQTAVPGSSTSFALGSFSDPGADHDWSVDVDWGDGSAHKTFFVTAGNQASGAALNLSLGTSAHTYATAGTDTVTVKVTDKDGASQTGTFQVMVSTAGASALNVAGFSSPTTAGTSQSFTVTVKDSGGNVVPSYTGTVHFTTTDSKAVLPADYTFTAADAGVHTFNATLKSAGTQTITATDSVTSSVTGAQSGITVKAAAVNALTIAGFPTTTVAGVAHSFIVTAKDAYGNIGTGYTGTVHFSTTDWEGALPANYTFTAADAGTHTFSATLKAGGSQTITATDTAHANLTAQQSGIQVSAAAFAKEVILAFPSSTVAGVAHAFNVAAQDAYSNTIAGYTGTVHFSTTDPQASIPADYTFTAADHGIHAFSATLKTAGMQRLSAVDTTLASSNFNLGVTVTPAAAAAFTVAAYPSPTTAGVAHTFTATVTDAYGNVVTGYTHAVHVTSSDAQATLPADYTFTAADAGKHTFTATLKTAGAVSITVTDTTASGVTGSHAAISVNPAAASSLSVAGFPASTTSGAPQNFTVTAMDPYGNPATGYTGTVHFTSSDAQATLPPNYNFTLADAGVHTFSATLKTAGTQAITATDTVTATITGTQSGISVSQVGASTLAVAGFPAFTTAGASQTFTVTAKDSNGNVVPGYRGTVHFTSNDPQATLPADYTFTLSDAGVHTFNATFKTAGSVSVTATDTATSSISGTQSGITVNPAAASVLIVAGFPVSTTSGSSQSFTVTLRDAYGNTASGYLGTVHFTSSDSQATLPADYTFTAGDAGARTFNASLKTAGSQSITATDTVASSITGSQSGITVVATGQAASFAITGYPATTAGVAQTFTVTVKDAGGNVVTGYTGTVHFSSSDLKAVLPVNYTFTAADAGVHTFSATLKTAGTQSITATDTVAGSVAGSQSGIAVAAATASAYVVSGFPASTVAGVPHTLTVTARDAFGNTANAYTGTVHFTTTDWEGALPANYTFTAADAGTHTFTATLKAAGAQTITATDTAKATITGQQTGIQVTVAAFAKVVIRSYPGSTVAGVAQAFTLAAQDAYANIIVGYTGTVHFSSTDPQATLPADYTFVAADRGVHSFSATLKTAGSQRLSVVDVTLASSNFNLGVAVTPAAAAALRINGYPSPTTAGAAHSFTVAVVDAFGNVVSGYVGTIHFTSSDLAAILPADYTFTAADAGKHTFTGTFKTTGTQTLTATDTVTATITGSQSGIVVQ